MTKPAKLVKRAHVVTFETDDELFTEFVSEIGAMTAIIRAHGIIISREQGIEAKVARRRQLCFARIEAHEVTR